MKTYSQSRNEPGNNKTSDARLLHSIILATEDVLRFLTKADPDEYAALHLNLYYFRRKYKTLTGCDWCSEIVEPSSPISRNIDPVYVRESLCR